ncbi:hypothetical protein HMPREF1870_00055 [Bacteroidales bacterium KA00344]|nr:hypothetical protein HMPREF1870_00055 [Bacteroidales bacterium KA00344]
MKRLVYAFLLLMTALGLTACHDEQVDYGLGISNVELPMLSPNSLGTEITIKGNGFKEDDVLALSAVSGSSSNIYLETRLVTPDSIVVFYPNTAIGDSYGLILTRGKNLRSLGVLISALGKMPDENLRKAISEYIPNAFSGDNILASVQSASFPDGLLDISGKNIESLEGLQYLKGVSKLVCSDNKISRIPEEVMHRLTELTAQNSGLTSLIVGTKERPNTTLHKISVDGCSELDSIDLYYGYVMDQFSATKCNLTYLDVRNFHSIWGGILNYNGDDYRFDFSDDASKPRKLKMESWWMDSYYSLTGPIVKAIEKGVEVEGYDWVHNYPNSSGTCYYSNGNYQKTMIRLADIPDAHLRSALKGLVPEVFEGDKVKTLDALNSSYFKSHTTLDLSNKGITNLEGLQYFCGYKYLILDGNNLGEVNLAKYAISTAYTAGPVDEKGLESISLKNAGLTKFVGGDQYMMSWIDISNNPDLTYIDVSRCKYLNYLNAGGCPLAYLDLRSLANNYSVLGYSGGVVDANRAIFSFTDATDKPRKLLVEEWWMDNAWVNGANACNTAKDKGVRIERYEYKGYDKDVMRSSFN